uniref:PH domain-containing protein n=1 Tax=Amorphochlora amoebiformis TaxID=1561963 RepID=A0A7S0CMP2_9EUKA
MHKTSYNPSDPVYLQITNGQYKGKWVEARILRPSGNYYVVQVEKTPLAMKAGLNKKELNVQGFVLKPRRLQAPSAPAPQAPPRPPPGVPPGPKARAPAPPAGRPPSARPPQPPTTAAPPRQAISDMKRHSSGFFLGEFFSTKSVPSTKPPAPGYNLSTSLPEANQPDLSSARTFRTTSDSSGKSLKSPRSDDDLNDLPDLTKKQLIKLQAKLEKWRKDRVRRSNALIKLEKENSRLRVQVGSLTEVLKLMREKLTGQRSKAKKAQSEAEILCNENETLKAKLSFLLTHSATDPQYLQKLDKMRSEAGIPTGLETQHPEAKAEKAVSKEEKCGAVSEQDVDPHADPELGNDSRSSGMSVLKKGLLTIDDGEKKSVKYFRIAVEPDSRNFILAWYNSSKSDIRKFDKAINLTADVKVEQDGTSLLITPPDESTMRLVSQEEKKTLEWVTALQQAQDDVGFPLGFSQRKRSYTLTSLGQH